MSVRMLTKDLLYLLNDHILTAQAEPGLAGCASILVHTSQVEEGAEPGGANCLVATSTNGYAIGHSWVEAGGYLPPTLLPIQYVRALVVALGKLINKDNKETHVTDLCRNGDHVVIAEDPDLFGGGFSQQFAYGDLDDWPRTLFPLLTSVYLTAPKDMKPVENRTDFAPSRLTAFLTIANRHNVPLSLYRVHQSLSVHIQIGHNYRGLIVPSGSWNDSDMADGQAPDAGVYAPELPEIKKQEPAEPETAGANA